MRAREMPMKLDAAVAVCFLLLSATLANGQPAARGRALLDDKGCLACHALEVAEPGKASHLGENSPELLSPARLAALLWNHDVFAPRSSRPVPKALTAGEARDLYAYFDSLRAFDHSGNPVRGKASFESRCASCHGGSRPSASPARDWAPIADLADWGERMWNAADAMEPALRRVGRSWPELDAEEAADLVAFLQGLSGNSARPPRPPDAVAGERTFTQAGCADCHGFGPSAGAKIDLLRVLNQEPENAGLVVALANHRVEMGRQAAQRRARLAPLRPGALASLLEYMRAQAALGVSGNRARGEHLFRLKGCLGCHGIPRSGAPELKIAGRRHDAYGIGGAFWRHAERARSVAAHIDPVSSWPELSAREVSDLTAFLNGE